MEFSRMSADEYIELRLREQQHYHSQKSSVLKRRFLIINIIVLIVVALIPVVTCLSDTVPLFSKILIASLSGTASVLTGYLSASKTQELFISYRMTSEQLKSIEFLYKTKAPPFDNADAFEKMVFLCENTICANNNNWYSTVSNSTYNNQCAK